VRRHGGLVFGALLGIDGVFLLWASYATGGATGPVRYLILVHVAAVTLLARWTTGLRLAAWHTLLQAGMWWTAHEGVVDHASRAASSAARTTVFVAALWVLTATVARLAAVNERELRRRRFELEQLAQMGRALEDANEPAAVADVLLDSLVDTFGFPRVALFEIVDDVAPRLLTCRNMHDARVGDFGVDQDSVLATAYRDRRTLLVRDLDATVDPWLAALLPDAHDVAVLPLVADAVVGVLVVETGQAGDVHVERRIVATAERFAGHAALAMRNAYLLNRVQQMAVTDGLTQLANRRSFDRALERELSRAVRTDGRLSVVLLDVDHFKRLNDTYGHVVGDAVLQQVARALRECGREYDTVARYGGEEFAVVLPGCSSALAVQVAERLRRAIEEGPTDVPVTASAGVATFPRDGIDAKGLLESADQALYASKRAGRNTVRSAAQARGETSEDTLTL
jgi:diguanylate cyclase (GGDEF)-like protein